MGMINQDVHKHKSLIELTINSGLKAWQRKKNENFGRFPVLSQPRRQSFDDSPKVEISSNLNMDNLLG